jgi:hypothetical protein
VDEQKLDIILSTPFCLGAPNKKSGPKPNRRLITVLQNIVKAAWPVFDLFEKAKLLRAGAAGKE